MAEDNKKTDPDGLSEVDEAGEELGYVVLTLEGLLDVFKANTGTGIARERNEEPDDASDGEEYGGEEEAVIVSELGDGEGGAESTNSACDFVENMLDEVGCLDKPQRELSRVNSRQWHPSSSTCRRFHRRRHMGWRRGDQQVLNEHEGGLT